MRLVLLVPIVLAATLACGELSGGGGAAAYEAELLAPGATVPDVTLTDLDGHAVPLASLRGKTVLLNFWFRH